MRTIEAFVEELGSIDESEFTPAGVLRYLGDARVDPATLEPYLFFTPTHYTRNLIHKCPLFELLAICWDVGQLSRIHNHSGQDCWMAVPMGKLAVQNYEVVRQDERSGSCELREADRFEMDPEHPGAVDRERPVHAVLNLPEYAARAVSLHVYSRPYDRCLVYSLENRSYREVPLFYDSEYGKPVAHPR
jgi:cysteine dioxygenase